MKKIFPAILMLLAVVTLHFPATALKMNIYSTSLTEAFVDILSNIAGAIALVLLALIARRLAFNFTM